MGLFVYLHVVVRDVANSLKHTCNNYAYTQPTHGDARCCHKHAPSQSQCRTLGGETAKPTKHGTLHVPCGCHPWLSAYSHTPRTLSSLSPCRIFASGHGKYDDHYSRRPAIAISVTFGPPASVTLPREVLPSGIVEYTVLLDTYISHMTSSQYICTSVGVAGCGPLPAF